jgi:glycogen synthase
VRPVRIRSQLILDSHLQKNRRSFVTCVYEGFNDIEMLQKTFKMGPGKTPNNLTEPLHTKQFKVLLLGPYPPPHGGVEISLVALRDFLCESKIACEVVNLTRHRKTEGGGVYYPKNAIELARLLIGKKTEIIHLHIGGDVSWRLLGLGFFCSFMPGRRLVLTLHSGGYPSSPSGMAARAVSLRGFLFRRFDGLIGVNQKIAGMFARFGVPQSKIRLILPFALPAHVPDVALPEMMHKFFETHSPILLTVSGLETEYELPLQIDILECIRNTHPRAGLLIIGKGSREAEILQAIKVKPYADHILLAGDVSHDVTLQAMSRSDIVLRTTLYDGDSIAVREALHLGIPVVATDNGMRPGGVNLIPVSDREALCQAVQAVLDVPRMRRKSNGADVTNLLAVTQFYRELLEEGHVPQDRTYASA